MSDKKPVNFRLRESTRDQLKTLAAKLKLTQTRIVEISVKQYFDKEAEK